MKRAAAALALAATAAAISPAVGSDTTIVYLPLAAMNGCQKGVAGGGDIGAVGACWHQRWYICGDAEYHCISAVKGDGAGLYPDQWDVDSLDHAAERCTGGYILAGDEYEIRTAWGDPWPMARQVAFLRTVEGIVAGRCKILWGGVNTVPPSQFEYSGGAAWIRAFHAAYLAEYGEVPGIAGMHFNAYLDLGDGDWIEATGAAIDAVREVYGPDAEVWLREAGCLESTGYACQVEAVRQFYQSDLPARLNRWAFFLSYEDAWAHASLWDVNGALTPYGVEYAGR